MSHSEDENALKEYIKEEKVDSPLTPTGVHEAVPDAFREMTPAEQVNAYLYSDEAVLFNHAFLHSASAEQQSGFVGEMLAENVSVAMFLYKLRYLDGLVRSGKGGCASYVCSVCVYGCHQVNFINSVCGVCVCGGDKMNDVYLCICVSVYMCIYTYVFIYTWTQAPL
jgi:hypothetical protein